jgi:hypothetical protein
MGIDISADGHGEFNEFRIKDKKNYANSSGASGGDVIERRRAGRSTDRTITESLASLRGTTKRLRCGRSDTHRPVAVVITF